jgi:crossover junction endodeoxyribonuclease RuvC
MEKPLRILGIDPGTTIAGYGLVEIRDKKPVILNMGQSFRANFRTITNG